MDALLENNLCVTLIMKEEPELHSCGTACLHALQTGIKLTSVHLFPALSFLFAEEADVLVLLGQLTEPTPSMRESRKLKIIRPNTTHC